MCAQVTWKRSYLPSVGVTFVSQPLGPSSVSSVRTEQSPADENAQVVAGGIDVYLQSERESRLLPTRMWLCVQRRHTRLGGEWKLLRGRGARLRPGSEPGHLRLVLWLGPHRKRPQWCGARPRPLRRGARDRSGRRRQREVSGFSGCDIKTSGLFIYSREKKKRCASFQGH